MYKSVCLMVIPYRPQMPEIPAKPIGRRKGDASMCEICEDVSGGAHTLWIDLSALASAGLLGFQTKSSPLNSPRS